MVETFIKEFLQERAAQIEGAGRRCPPRGWTLLEARDECASILGIGDQWQRLSSNCLAALSEHENLYPEHWSRARKRLMSEWAGGALLRAISESKEGSEIKERLKQLSDEYVRLDLRLKGLLRALLRTGTWLAEGSVDKSTAPRTIIDPDAWNDLRVMDWSLDVASHVDAKRLRGSGHVHAVRVRTPGQPEAIVPADALKRERRPSHQEWIRSWLKRNRPLGVPDDPRELQIIAGNIVKDFAAEQKRVSDGTPRKQPPALSTALDYLWFFRRHGYETSLKRKGNIAAK